MSRLPNARAVGNYAGFYPQRGRSPSSSRLLKPMRRPPGPAVAMTLSQADGTQPSSERKVTVSSHPPFNRGIAVTAGCGLLDELLACASRACVEDTVGGRRGAVYFAETNYAAIRSISWWPRAQPRRPCLSRSGSASRRASSHPGISVKCS